MSAADVSRLLGRVAFGATADDLDQWTGKPYADLVDHLLQVSTLPAIPPLPDDAERIQYTQQDKGTAEAQRWWLERMRSTPFPLLERMTLLWHGHFATGVRYPPTAQQLVAQNQTLRLNALGNLKTLIGQLTIDPAMLYWLNGMNNAVPRPNENYAREFFELFTLGKRPQVYTEHDVREAARAFTGWIIGGSSGQPSSFVANRHDHGTKRILGSNVTDQCAQEYLALADLALAQPVAARFFAYKLVANLAYVPDTPNLLKSNDALLNKVAAELKKQWDIAAAVRVLLLADEFRYASPGKGRQLVRQPVDVVVHAAKALGVSFNDTTLLYPLQRMGQSIFDPVNVGGWPLGRDWISPVTALARYDVGLTLYTLATKQPNATLHPLPAPDDLVAWTKRLGLAALSQNTTDAVAAYLRRVPAANTATKAAGVLALLLSSPEWVVL